MNSILTRNDISGFLDPTFLQLIILPTEDCNFRCTYCYEDYAIGRMSDETLNAIKAHIQLRLPKLNTLRLSWFGGEPLIAKDIVAEITAFSKEKAVQSGVSFSADITTNAFTLKKALFESLTNMGIRTYQISLDGDELEHDKTRKLITNKGTFAGIWSNLVSIKSSVELFHIMLRVHVHSNNFESVKSLLVKINQEFGSDTRFTILLRAVSNLGGDGVKQLNLIRKTSELLDELKADLKALGWYSNRHGQEDPIESLKVCYAAMPSSLVVRADGTLAKCTVAFNDPRNRIGKINPDGTLAIETPLMHNFMRGFESLDESELSCPMKTMPVKSEVVQFHKTLTNVLTVPV